MKTRDTSNGQYKKSSKLFPTLIILTIIILSIFAIRQKLISPVAEVAPTVIDQTDYELKAIMDEESFKKAMELKALKIKIERKKSVEMDRHTATMKDIEVQLEAVRKQELDKTSL